MRSPIEPGAARSIRAMASSSRCAGVESDASSVRTRAPRDAVFAFSHASAFTSRCSTAVKSLPIG